MGRAPSNKRVCSRGSRRDGGRVGKAAKPHSPGARAQRARPAQMSRCRPHLHPAPQGWRKSHHSGQCPLGDLPHVSRQEGGGGHGAGGPTERCQVPWEASMAPAVSWKSRSCCRKRMACVGEKMGPRRPRAGLGGQTASPYALPATIPGQGQGRGSASDGGLHTSGFMLRVWLSGKDIVCWGC